MLLPRFLLFYVLIIEETYRLMCSDWLIRSSVGVAKARTTS